MNPRIISSSMILRMTSRRGWMARHSSWICPAPGGELALVEAEEAEAEATDQAVEALLLAKDRAVEQDALEVQEDLDKVGV